MLRIRNVSGILLLSLLLPFTSPSGEVSTPEKRQAVEEVRQLIEGILRGEHLDQAVSHVAADAYVVDGREFRSLWGVLRGEFPDVHLVEGVSATLTFQSLSVMDNLDAASMVIATRHPQLGERVHSVMLFREGREGWQIMSWHIGK